MINISMLRKRAKREKIVYTARTDGATLAKQLAEKRAKQEGVDSPPDCFGRLTDLKSKKCKLCVLKDYCAYVKSRKNFDGLVLYETAEVDADIGFKEGSRPYRLIKKWGKRLATESDLRDLSKSMFGSVIDINNVLTVLRKRRKLRVVGKRYGLDSRT